MKKLNSIVKNLIALSLLIALGLMGLEVKVNEPFNGIESIEISTAEVSAEVYVNVTLQTAYCSSGASYKRCWYGGGSCDTDWQTFCDDELSED